MAARYQTISNWVTANDWRYGVELGVLSGLTFLYVLEHCPKLHLTGVDVWDDTWVEIGTHSGERCFCDYCNETRMARRGNTPQQLFSDLLVEAQRVGSGRFSLLAMPTDA